MVKADSRKKTMFHKILCEHDGDVPINCTLEPCDSWFVVLASAGGAGTQGDFELWWCSLSTFSPWKPWIHLWFYVTCDLCQRYCLKKLDFLHSEILRYVDRVTMMLVNCSLSRGNTFREPLLRYECCHWWWFRSNYCDQFFISSFFLSCAHVCLCCDVLNRSWHYVDAEPLRHELECNGMVPPLNIVSVFSWKMKQNDVVSQKRIFPLDLKHTYFSKSVESPHSFMLKPPHTHSYPLFSYKLFC
jgi:hypothetical protein